MPSDSSLSHQPVKNIVISGTNFWNPGDDFVREGVIAILRKLFPGELLNFLFYNFNPDCFPQDKFEGLGNVVSKGDLERYRDSIDLIVIAGLSAGAEIKDLYRWILDCKLEERVWIIGGGYENGYVEEHISTEPEVSIFRKAKIVVGRTAKAPGFLGRAGVSYVHLNCPAILSVPEVKTIPAGKKIERVGFSIQLPHGIGLVNQSCAASQFELALKVLEELSIRHEVEVVAHHKTEYFYFLERLKGRGIPVIFSSFYQDLSRVYTRYDLFVTTRLHASLFANGHGTPGIIINDTDRHTHTLAGFPHSIWVNTKESFDREFKRISRLDLSKVAEEAKAFKEELSSQYLKTLGPIVTSNSSEPYRFDSELKEQALVRAVVRPGMTVFDVGANVGKYTRLFSELVGEIGQVFAFEPDPYTQRQLEAAIAEGRMDNVRLRSEAITNKAGVAQLNQFPEEYCSWNSLGHPRMPDPKDPSQLVPLVGSVEVPTVTLSGFCKAQKLERIDYLKLDVEGAEILALEGARELLAKKAIRFLQFEISRNMLEGLKTNARRIFDYLGEWGYTCHAITESGTIGEKVTDSTAFYENYIAIPSVSTGDTAMFQHLGEAPAKSDLLHGKRKVQTDSSNGASPAREGSESGSKELPIHFFTIVLNGRPFIEHHIYALQQLTIPWHWHIVEGVAELNHDTAWSKAGGGAITEELHEAGLSNDGTTEYLNELARVFPEQVTIYRKPASCFWDGKLEMVNTPLRNIHEECLLWQLDADELWTAEQIQFAQRLFKARPDKTAAFYYCHYFVGKDRVITTRDTYGNHSSYEWLRTWRFTPGCRWTAHEPPRLCQASADGGFVDVATINPFRHKETEPLDLVFQHYAYALEAQVRFKEVYYGYSKGVEGWKRLQAETKFPVRLSEYFQWVKDKATVNTASSQGIVPLLPAELFQRIAEPRTPGRSSGPKRVLLVRSDAIGDTVLAAGMLASLRQKYFGAQIAVLCQEHVAELWAASPCVDAVIGFDKARALSDGDYKKAVQAELKNWRPELILNSIYSSEALFEELVQVCERVTAIGLEGDLANISEEQRKKANGFYTKLIASPAERTEIEHHQDFLNGLGIEGAKVTPTVWTTPNDDALAEIFFQSKGLDPERTIALFPGSQHSFKMYRALAEAVNGLSDFKAIIFGGADAEPLAKELLAQLPMEAVNLVGKTTLREMASLMRKCRLYAGADSAGAHIACAVGLPNVVILGGGHFGRFFPYSALTSVACLPLDCYGCNWRCEHSSHHCVSDIAPRVVDEAIRQTLASSSDKPRIFFQQERIGVGPAWKSPKSWITTDVQWIACPSNSSADVRCETAANSSQRTSEKPASQEKALSDSNLSEVEKNWNEFGKRDPLWAILTDEKRKNNRWDIGEFFALGEREISSVIQYLEDKKIPYNKGRALDFGCGVGRLTQALCKRFTECHGVDIAASMVEQARSYNRFGARCYYHLNKSTDLSLFEEGTFDFVYSNIVLQHNRPENSRKFIREFCRVLAPGGILVFQIPSHPIGFEQMGNDRMAAEAFQAEIKLHNPVEQALAGTSLELKISVRNASKLKWPLLCASTSNAIKLGNHWLDGLGRSIVHDDARASLPVALEPGQSAEFALSVCVPGKPGRYILELDMVQEHVCWFANHGSKTARLNIEVLPNSKLESGSNRAATSGTAEVLVPRMEMHGIPKEQVIAFLNQTGVTVLDVRDDSNAAGWIGYRYCVTKAAKEEKREASVESAGEPKAEVAAQKSGKILVSAIVSTFNSERFIRGCLENLTRQTLFKRGEMEIVVINSGSTENEEAIVLEFQKTHPRIVYSRTERETLYAAWNRGLLLVRGTYFVNANTDDGHRDDAFEKMAAALEKNPSAPLGYAHCAWTNAPHDTFGSNSEHRTIVYPAYHPALSLFYCFTGCMQFWRVSALKQLGGFDAELKAVGDFDILHRFVKSGMQAVLVPEVLSLFYQNEAGLTQQSTDSQLEEATTRGRARAEVNIRKIFNADSEEGEALGWAALGLWAAGCPVPWLAQPVMDAPFALQCFEKASCLAPGHTGILHNLIVELSRAGRSEDADIFLSKLTTAHGAALREALARKEFVHASVSIAPAVEPLVEGLAPAEYPLARPATRTLSIPPAAATKLPVRWLGPIFNPSGYASEAINFILPLAGKIDLGVFHHTTIYSENFVKGLAQFERDTLFFLREKFRHMSGGIAISHNPATGMCDVQDAAYRIGRTMFETDRIAPDWVTACNQMDEIWVPSAFNVETFAQSGVEREKLFVIPEAVDESEFDPERHQPLALPARAKFNFLSIFEWSTRKGWDVLLSAYLREFSAADDVCLYLRTYLFSQPDGDPSETIWGLIREHAAKLNLGDKPWPRIHLIPEQVPQAELPRLYKAMDCLVAPSRGEGWGRPHHEAMMMGLPVIATNWSGNTEYMNSENSFPIDYELVEAKYLEPELLHYRGHRWANPSESSLRSAMRQVVENPELGRSKGKKAREHMLAHFSREAVAKMVVERLQTIERTLAKPVCAPATVRERQVNPRVDSSALEALQVTWEGSFLDYGSLSQVNRQITEHLAKQPKIQLTSLGKNTLRNGQTNVPELQRMARRMKAQAPRQTDVTVRHGWPPRWDAPPSGQWVVIQPWEFGYLPTNWVQQLSRVDEAWVPSEYVRRVYLNSGVHPEKVKVVPNGVDPSLFHPGAAPMQLKTKKRFRFLFVGGTIHRKGPDVLLDAYLSIFTAKDDVCLVIKDFGGDGVYAGQTFREQIKAAQMRPNAPEILYLTEELNPSEMAGLYTACHCLVHPYRGEGFGLPVLESMACGLPVVVTGGGATDDFATDEFAYRVEAARRVIGPVVAEMPLAHNGWLLEPSPSAVAGAMREVFENPESAKAKGLRGSEHVRREWTWEKAAQIAAERLHALAQKKRTIEREKAHRRARKTTSIALPPVAALGNLMAARGLVKEQSYLSGWNAALKAIQERPFHPEAYLLLAEIARAVNDMGQARTCLEMARHLAPRWKAAQHFPRVLTPKPGGPKVRLPEAIAESGGKLPKLSVCLIVKNEEKFLGRCLESVREIADQIVVVDTGSTDWSRDIAARYGAEVYSFEWCNDFSAARNAALERATGDWILMLDADEELPVRSRENLRKELAAQNVVAYRLPILEAGREEEGCSHVPRLFRNAPGLFFVGRVHEQIFSSIEARRIEWGMENCLGTTALLHHGYSAEVTRSRNKIARNLTLLELAIEEMPNEPNLVMNYGLELVRCGRPAEGLGHYWEAFHLLSALPSEQIVPELRETLLTQLTSQLMNAKDYRGILAVLQSPLSKKAGLTASLHFILGLALLELKQFSEAGEQFQFCLKKRDRAVLSPVHKDIRKGGPRHCLALCQKMLNQPEAAAKNFAEALEEDPKSIPVRLDYAMFLEETNQSVEALKVLNSLLGEHPEHLSAWLIGGKIALNHPELHAFAEEWTGEAMKHHAGDAMVQVQRAEALTLNQHTEGALPLWRKTRFQSPRYVAARVLCEVVAGTEFGVESAQEQAVSVEFLNWYRYFLQRDATDIVMRIHQLLPQFRRILPSAAVLLGQALEEAAKDTAV